MTDELITILHTNDLHSHIEHWPAISYWIKNRKKELQKAGHEVFVFDIGDFIDRSDDNTQATWGKDNAQLLNDAGYDGITIGNNEGLGLPHERMEEIYDQRKFAVLLANILENDHSRPKWAEDYRVFVTKAKTRVSVFGLTAAYEMTYPLNDWIPVQPFPVISELEPRLSRQSDVQILLSHLGLPVDEEIAGRFPSISLILGAHTHHLLPVGKKVNKTMLAAAGKYGENVGEVQIRIDAQHKIVDVKAHTISFDDLIKPEYQPLFIKSWHDHGRKVLSDRIVAFLPKKIDRFQQLKDCAAALKENFHTDIAMVSSGMFMDDLLSGPLDSYQLLKDMPHTINPMLAKMDGKLLLELIKEVKLQQPRLLDLHINGAGFRGDKFGRMFFFGIQEEQIDPDGHYELASLDHYYFLPWFHSLQKADVSFDFKGILRQLMAKYYNEKYASDLDR